MTTIPYAVNLRSRIWLVNDANVLALNIQLYVFDALCNPLPQANYIYRMQLCVLDYFMNNMTGRTCACVVQAAPAPPGPIGPHGGPGPHDPIGPHGGQDPHPPQIQGIYSD